MRPKDNTLLGALLTAAALAPAAAAAPQWQQQSPSPAPPQVHPRLGFLDAQHGYLVGFEPTPLETTDGGYTWHPATLPASGYSQVFALDDQHAWVVGPSHTARTVDGGQSWEALSLFGIDDTVEFLTPDFGWTASNYAAAITHDGGLSWNIAIIDSSTRVTFPDFRDPQLGVGVEEDFDSIWRTTDGGASWQQVFSAPANHVAFLDASTVLAAGGGQVHRSTDAGLTWQTVASGVNGSHIRSLSADHALIHQGLSYSVTSDGGLTWSHGNFDTGANVTSIEQVFGLELLAVDTSGNVLRSTDGGASWSVVRQGSYVGLSALSIIPGGHGVAAGNGYVIVSEDGGSSWFQTSSGTGERVYDIAMWDGQRGLFCGASATVCRTSDGGAFWETGRPAWGFLGMNDAEAISVVEPAFAIVVGEAGAPVVTHDGGASWTQLASFPASHSLHAVDFVTEQEGWASSAGGTAWIVHTADGGQSWTVQYGPYSGGGVPSLDMIDASTGYALVASDIVAYTHDGGDTWLPSFLPIPQGGVDLDFHDAQHGWVVGSFGVVLRTTDGAASWQDLSLGGTAHFNAVEAVGPDEAYVVGDQNKVLRTVDGGQSWQSLAVPAPAQQTWETVRVVDGAVWIGGWNGLVLHLPAEEQRWEVYCSAKTSSNGCLPTVDASGTPGPDAGAPFVIRAEEIPSRQPGIFFYGLDGPASTPFQGGTLCVAPRIRRTPPQNAGGSFPPSSDCSGAFDFDLDAWILGGNDPALVPGTSVHGQFWFRDPADPFGTGLSDAIELTIQP